MEENKPNHILIFFVTLTTMTNLTSANEIIQLPLTRHTQKGAVILITSPLVHGHVLHVNFKCEDFVILGVILKRLTVNFLMEKESNLTAHDGNKRISFPF